MYGVQRHRRIRWNEGEGWWKVQATFTINEQKLEKEKESE